MQIAIQKNTSFIMIVIDKVSLLNYIFDLL
jgi:hypothetical protein